MRHKISITLILVACALSLGILLIPPVRAWHPTPTESQTASAAPTPINTCCGKKPPLLTPITDLASPPFTGQVVVATNLADAPDKPSVVIWDLTKQATAPLNEQWNSLDVPNETNSYSSPKWTREKIGDVFGLTLDNNGNIYVAATKVYGTNFLGSPTITPGTPGHGDIYKIDGTTGSVTRFVQSDNFSTYQGGNKIPNKGPGLGNIHYSCDYQKLYASNFEDGMIYRIDLSGNILSKWDHGQNLPTATPSGTPFPDVDGASNNHRFTPLGRRPWAVQVYNGRLYYSIWWHNHVNPPNPGDPPNPNPHPNEIWSIGLTPTGDFTGSARREIVLDFLSPDFNFSNPVSDISFSPSGKMLLAERSMYTDDYPTAHESRLLEYSGGSPWVLQNPNKFQIGGLTYSNGVKTNSAGGCDYDTVPNGRVWATGDYLMTPGSGEVIYGLQGTPAGGGSNLNSILIDLDDEVSSQDKTYIGDVEIPCFPCSVPPRPPDINGPDYTCAVSGKYCVSPVAGLTYTWNVNGGTTSTGTGQCQTITWNSGAGNKTIIVTATDANKCTSTSRLVLSSCDLHLGACCSGDLAPRATLVGFSRFNASGVYSLTSNLYSPTSVVRVTANILSTSVTYTNASCGTSGPANSYITAVYTAATLTPSLLVPKGNEAIWFKSGSGSVNLSPAAPFKINIQFPPPPTGDCTDYLSFCIKYTFMDIRCRTCEIIRCYRIFRSSTDEQRSEPEEFDPAMQ